MTQPDFADISARFEQMSSKLNEERQAAATAFDALISGQSCESWLNAEMRDRLRSPRRLYHPFVAVGMLVRHWTPEDADRKAYIEAILADSPETLLTCVRTVAEAHVAAFESTLGTCLDEAYGWRDMLEHHGRQAAPVPVYMLEARDDLESYATAHRLSGAHHHDILQSTLASLDRQAVEHCDLHGKEPSDRRLLAAASLDSPLAWWGAYFEREAWMVW